ncbi:MAG: DUF2269 domain-containing protein [Actinomycetota bacterium]|nr:DUF2269 domain-containing protein [Actinomycetota bacterium]
MDRYEVLKFVHIAAAIVWIGGAVAIQFFAHLARKSGDAQRMVALTRDVEWIGKRVFTPAALIVVVLGFILVWDGPWTLGMDWIWISLVIFAISFAVGVGFFTPESIRIGKMIEAEGAESPAVQARITRILNLIRIDLVLLFAIVYLMVAKPGV